MMFTIYMISYNTPIPKYSYALFYIIKYYICVDYNETIKY